MLPDKKMFEYYIGTCVILMLWSAEVNGMCRPVKRLPMIIPKELELDFSTHDTTARTCNYIGLMSDNRKVTIRGKILKKAQMIMFDLNNGKVLHNIDVPIMSMIIILKKKNKNVVLFNGRENKNSAGKNRRFRFGRGQQFKLTFERRNISMSVKQEKSATHSYQKVTNTMDTMCVRGAVYVMDVSAGPQTEFVYETRPTKKPAHKKNGKGSKGVTDGKAANPTKPVKSTPAAHGTRPASPTPRASTTANNKRRPVDSDKLTPAAHSTRPTRPTRPTSPTPRPSATQRPSTTSDNKIKHIDVSGRKRKRKH